MNVLTHKKKIARKVNYFRIYIRVRSIIPATYALRLSTFGVPRPACICMQAYICVHMHASDEGTDQADWQPFPKGNDSELLRKQRIRDHEPRSKNGYNLERISLEFR